MLLAVTSGDLLIAYVSANAESFLGIAPATVLGRPLAEILTADSAAAILKSHDAQGRKPGNRLNINLPGGGAVQLLAFTHRVNDLICVEIEKERQTDGWDNLTERMEVAVEGIREAKTQQELCNQTVRGIRALTGHDHVMIYRFHPDDHGEVVAEDKEPHVASFLHLHFPASDIPSQARALYLLQQTRSIADVDSLTSPILGDPLLTKGRPLDMTRCTLRSVSPVHIQYMKNMGVGSSFAISLIDQQRLWGLIICHHRKPLQVQPEVRSLCDVLGQIISMLIGVTDTKDRNAEELDNRGRLGKVASMVASGRPMADLLPDYTQELLAPLRATGVLVQLHGYARLGGVTPPLQDALALMHFLRGRLSNGITSCDAVPTLKSHFAEFAPVSSGALMISVADSTDDCVVWFRPEVLRTIEWGGNPGESKKVDPASGQICPRTSFAAWTETQRGKAAPWTRTDIAAALELQHTFHVALLRQADAEAQTTCVDTLTNLPNRRVLLHRLSMRREHPSESPASLIFIDIDRFKLLNDTFGHDAGDALLIQVGKRLVARAEGKHLVARLGGDEFVVCCEDLELDEASILAQLIIEDFREPFSLDGRPFRCAASVGLAPTNGRGMNSIADILHTADSAMYSAKQKGGNQFVVFEIPQHEKLVRRVQLEQDLFHAIERGEMKVHFQAQISLDEGRLIGFEALLRWQHQELGNISPAEFIPMAEYTGNIRAIGVWVLEESLRHIGDWRSRYSTNLFVAVNVSPQQMETNNFAEQVRDALSRAGLPSSALHLEVTESMLMQSSAEVQLDAIQALGVRIAIDDFGTGYSSLSYLPRLAVSTVKLDRTFLEDVGTDERKTQLFGAIVRMAHTLNLVVVAEGIEDACQLECIRSYRCDAAQGYLLSRPIPAETVEQLLETEWRDGLLSAVLV
ncbi:diguanylate cyclase/phosphodiesterase (GGDEF & EAL domains) with PAS/PAC sensor(s) [Acidisarcina polymorpha]|uniref:Diguanylate cyclase/phosphodiesterase (GGDEF & EAL domains) with PAS/PAC sensor(S) n=2 Tax=Acidisarcina polymorpha TaxID=2211140 RepID=A0A2Z5G1F8_9BACT|nr:diguanylate cyclase/phosphodiesterase (GGDEF & EAL domains) with PAS/PAC sensor(s) [Acidisarcina polymorpha]